MQNAGDENLSRINRPHKVYYTFQGKQHKKAYSNPKNAREEFEFRKRAKHTPARLTHIVYHAPGVDPNDFEFDDDLE